MRQSVRATGERTLPGQWNRYEFERIYRLVASRFGGANKYVLDYGCGSGFGAAHLADHFRSVVGVDPSEEAIAFCRGYYKKENLRFEVLESDEQPFPDESFDLIGSFQVLEHIPLSATSSVIRSIWAMLKPGGTAVITTPNSANYFGGHSGNPFHVKEYTRDELEQLFGELIPPPCFCVLAVADVPSTRLAIAVRRALRGSRAGRYLGYTLGLPLRMLERSDIIAIEPEKMVMRGKADVIGGFFVEITKPLERSR